ncbi:CoA transferase [Alicyclobacillus hesperidum]|uniref:CoA transferase n=1 Tax=Alicyclobacillus hesperidum TaxID=89784 RepID=A0A1H2X8Z3_9BACL|nr:CoA transferase [Alicyclobacillus hesperidum]GLV14227.1 CoA transferase [Alicyclobacillus hesperidum]SDW89373.1 Crotonobetainyl-CoA:carnitine CoA-transferase CaiB [Alicyclobacillus hesperidum]
MKALLDGIRVLDMSTMIAAPTTASLLADYGAEVVKVEQPGRGDFVRTFGAQKQGHGLYWKTLSRNKRSVALDLHLPGVQQLIKRWITSFDVVIENFRPGTLEKWNLGPDTLLDIHPGLVILRVTAYGQQGPYRDRPGFGTLAEAMTGVAAVTGYDDRPPLLPAFPLADVVAGYLGSAAVLAALYKRQQTGEGEIIDLAIYEALMKVIELQILEFDQNGTLHKRKGNQLQDTAPRGAYLCSDGRWMALSGSTQPVAERVLRAIGGETLVRDPRFRTNLDRVQHADELDALIEAWCKERTRDEAIEELSNMGCAVGPLETVDSMLKNPQIQARESVVTVHDPDIGPMRMTGVFPKFSRSKPTIHWTGPSVVGQDTFAVLARDLGLSPTQIQALNETGDLSNTKTQCD